MLQSDLNCLVLLPTLFNRFRGGEKSPPYFYQEYPKWVNNSDGIPQLVKNEEEEQEVLNVVQKPKAKRGRPKK